MPEVPLCSIYQLYLASNHAVPDNAVPTVNVPLLVNVTVVTVTLGIENVPVSVWLLVSKVYTPYRQ